jgi:glycosyltransferase involved in cell wall biosynthesis
MNWQDRENPQAGGAEIHLHEIFGRLVRRGHRVTLLASSWPGARPRATLDGIEVWRSGSRHTWPLTVERTFRQLPGGPPELVIEDLNKVPLFTPWWIRQPLLLLVHHLFGRTAFAEAGLPVATATWLLERPLGRVYRGVPVQAVSQSTADDLVARGFRADRITVIPNGVDLETYSPDPDGRRFSEPTVLYVGRLKRYKRVDLVLHAVARLVAQGVRVRLIVAGQGDHGPALRALRDQLGLADIVQMPGFVSEAEKVRLLRQAWVHTLASPKEGWGITNLEAAACATPTVASDSPGLRDSVVHGETGLLVPHGDIAQLAAALRRVLEDDALRRHLSAGARRFALGFSWDRSADLTEAHLTDVLRGARPGGTQPQDAPAATGLQSRSQRRK